MAKTRKDATPREESARPRWKTALVVLVKWVLFVAVLAVVGRVLVQRFAEVSWSEIPFRPGWLMAAIVAGLAVAGVTFLPYYLLMGYFGHRPPTSAVMTSLWVAQVGKYLPGKVGSVVGLVWLLRRYRVPVGVSAGTVVMVDGLSAIVGILIAVPLTLYEPIRARLPLAWLWCLILVVVGVVCLHPRIFGALCNVVLRWLGQEPLPRLPRVRDLVCPTLALLGQFCLGGIALWLLAWAFTDVEPASLPVLISGGTLAMIVGFLSFFAPGGLGVHEGLLIVVLGPFIGGANAAILAVANRFVKTAGEAVLAATGLALRHFLPSLGPESPESLETAD